MHFFTESETQFSVLEIRIRILRLKSKTVELILMTHIVLDMLSSFFPILKMDILLSCWFCCDVGDAYTN